MSGSIIELLSCDVLHTDHRCIYISVQPPWLVCICWSGVHDHIRPIKYARRKGPQGDAREANEQS